MFTSLFPTHASSRNWCVQITRGFLGGSHFPVRGVAWTWDRYLDSQCIVNVDNPVNWFVRPPSSCLICKEDTQGDSNTVPVHSFPTKVTS